MFTLIVMKVPICTVKKCPRTVKTAEMSS